MERAGGKLECRSSNEEEIGMYKFKMLVSYFDFFCVGLLKRFSAKYKGFVDLKQVAPLNTMVRTTLALQ